MRCSCGGTLEPMDDNWAKCNKCNDSTFPVSHRAAYGCEPVELTGTLNGESMTGHAFGESAMVIRAQTAEAKVDRMRSKLRAIYDECQRNDDVPTVIADWAREGLGL